MERLGSLRSRWSAAEPHAVLALNLRCPTCGRRGLHRVGEDDNLLCHRCGACWPMELSQMRQVDPFHCGGCPSRLYCLATMWPKGSAPSR